MKLISHQKSAIITVYLSLVLGIILSFIVTTIECARLNTVRSYFNRVLQTSMESSLCDFYLPLFEDYHLFGYDLESGTLKEHKEKVSAKIMENINDNLELEKRTSILSYLKNTSNHNFLMCNPKLNKVDLNNFIYLSNDGGDYAKNQMVEYMKYQAPLELFNLAMETTELIEGGEATGKLLGEKEAVEKEMAGIDKDALDLVQMVDGIETNEYGVEISSFTKMLSIEDVFIKQIVTDQPTMQSMGINNSTVFGQVEDGYLRFPEVLDQLISKANGLMETAKELELIDPNKCSEDERIEYEKQVEEYEQECYVARNIAQYLTDTVTKVDQMIDQALTKIESIESKRIDLNQSYQDYMNLITEKKDEIQEDIYNELCSGATELERYSNPNNSNVSMIQDIVNMKETLLKNQKLLEEVLANPAVPFSLEEDEFKKWVAVMNTWRDQLSGLSTEGLEFDYSTFSVNPEGISPLDFVNELMGSSLASLVVDESELSNQSLSGVELPSNGSTYSEGLESFTVEDLNIESIFNGSLKLGNWNINFGGGMDQIDGVIDDLLLNAYVMDHMTNFTSDEFTKGQVVSYEQEYIMNGDLEEKDNFYSVIIKLLLIRIFMNCISVLCDSKKQSQAMKTAQLTVGWIPVAGITVVVKMLILIYWAYCQAVVEVSALVHGKSVPVYTTAEDFKVEYAELLSMNRAYVKGEVAKYECKSMLRLSYSQYLFVLMLLVSDEDIVYRSLDLIQENLRNEYDESFRIKNCLISYSCEANGYMKQKFLFLPFFKQHDISIDGYNITGQTAVTY